MKQKLQQIEKALEELIEGGALRVLGSPDAEKELISQLVKTIEDQIQESPDGGHFAPHIFTLSVPAEFSADIRTNQALLDKIAINLTQQASEAGIRFAGNININVFPDDELEQGEFKIQAINKTSDLAQTSEVKLDEELSPTPKPPKAFLIVEGSKIFTIEHDVINIGRLLENHLVLDDPRVSRLHAQLRAVKGRHILFDLGSSGGTFVNGERVSQVSLHPGDVIFLAGVPLVYGQDMITNLNETQEYIRPKHTDEFSTTTVRIRDLNLDIFEK
jgi:hypothetical protein